MKFNSYFRPAIEGIVSTTWWESAFIRYVFQSNQPSSPSNFYYFNPQENLLCLKNNPCDNFINLIKLYPDIASDIMSKCVDEDEEEIIYDFRLIENTFYIPDCK